MRAQLLVRMHPARWRERYGAEFGALVEELPFSLSVVADVCRNVLRAQIAERSTNLRASMVPGGSLLSSKRPLGFMLSAALLLPSVALLVAFTLKYKFGMPDPFDTLWYGAAQSFHPLNYLLVFAPPLWVLVAVRPLVGISLGRGGAALQVTGRVEPLMMAVVLGAVFLSALLFRYFVGQHLMPPVLIPTPWVMPLSLVTHGLSARHGRVDR